LRGQKQDLDRKTASPKQSHEKISLIVECLCGAQILLVPDLKAMNQAIENHLANHTKLEKSPRKKTRIANHVRQFLTEQVIEKATELARISERMKAEKALHLSEERYRSLFNSMSEGFALCEVLLDSNDAPYDFRFLEVNNAYEKQIGTKALNLIGKTVREYSPGIKAKSISILGNVALTRESVRFEDFNEQTKKYFDVFSFSPMPGQVAMLLVDITEDKKLQTELEKYAEHLENLVEERTEKLKNTERLAAIGETAAMVGHDIRNPLQSILGELYLEKKETESLPETDLKKKLEENIKTIEDQILYINKIVGDLQDFSKTLAPTYEKVDLKKVANDVLSDLNCPTNIKVAINIEVNAELITDAASLKRILTNLCLNAVQAMPKGGKLAVGASSKNGKVRLSVEDTGEGIPEEIRDKIFKPLFTTKSKGQGFGLAVVKKLTEGLHGEVTFESGTGKGTIFTLEFPKTPPTTSLFL
jgi:signal transduction histidine kinase